VTVPLLEMNSRKEWAAFLLLVAVCGCSETKAPLPLHEAAKEGDVAAVAAAIRKGADLNACDEYDHTALNWAAGLGHKQVVELLLNEGAEASAPGGADLRPLHFAAGLGHKDVASLLLAKGAAVSSRTTAGEPPPAPRSHARSHGLVGVAP